MTDAPLIPHDWQESDLTDLLFWDLTGLIAIETGGGKSLLAVEAAHRAGIAHKGSVLVIAPKSTFSDAWIRTVKRQTGEDVRVVNSTKPGVAAEADLRANKPGWYLINHELFTRRDWEKVTPELCVLDEAHKLGNYDSKGGKKLRNFHAKRRLAMSATPYRNKFENMWNLMRWLYPERNGVGDIADKSRRRWISYYCATKPDFFAGEVVTGEKVPGRLVSLVDCYIYHAKRQPCCSFHPEGFLKTEEPTLEVRTLEMPVAMRKAYRQLEQDYVTFLEDNPLVVELPIVLRARLRQFALGMVSLDDDGEVFYAEDCVSPKFDELVTVLDELDGEPVLVLTHSKKFASVVTRRLQSKGIAAAEWSGDTSMKDRARIEREFEAGTVRVIVGVIAAMGTGVSSLARVCSTCVWLSRSDDATDNEQALGRLDRLDSIGRVANIEIQMEGTHDQGVFSKDLVKALERNASMKKS